MPKRKLKILIPFIIFLIIAVVLGRGLKLHPRRIPSALLDKPAPHINLDTVYEKGHRLTNRDFIGQVSLLNVWATWCTACQAEHPVLMEIAKTRNVVILGLDYKDDMTKAREWLSHLGDPFQLIGFDQNGKTAIDWGVYGTPETFVIDKQGIIRYKHVGALTMQVWEDELLPLVERLNG